MARRKLEEALFAGEMMSKDLKVVVEHDIQLEPEMGGVYSLQYSFDGEYLAVGCGSGTIRLYRTKDGKAMPDIRKTRYGGFPIMVLKFHPRNPQIIYAGTSEGQVLSCNISDFYEKSQQAGDIESCKDERWKEIIQETKNGAKNEINCLDFDFTKTRFATAGKDLSIRIYDAIDNQLVSEYTGYDNTKSPTDQQFSGCSARVFALRFHPLYDDIFITGGWDRQLKIWDARSNDGVKRTIHGPHICGDALDIKDYKILTGSFVDKHALQIWDYSGDYSPGSKLKPKEVFFPVGPEKEQRLYAAQFGEHDIVIAGGSGSKSAAAIHSETDEVIGEVKFEKGVQALDTYMGGRLFAVGDGGHGLKMCRLK